MSEKEKENESTEQFDFEAFKKIIDRLATPLSDLQKQVREGFEKITADMKIVKRTLTKNWGVKFDEPVTAHTSPLQLTDIGKRVAKKLDKLDIFPAFLHQAVLNTIHENKIENLLRTPGRLDIQEYCQNFTSNMQNFNDPKLMDGLREIAYSEGGNVDLIFEVVAVLFRDAIFENLQIKPDSKYCD